eukprot:7652738-Pyramimonas_sp.AAC.1
MSVRNKHRHRGLFVYYPSDARSLSVCAHTSTQVVALLAMTSHTLSPPVDHRFVTGTRRTSRVRPIGRTGLNAHTHEALIM